MNVEDLRKLEAEATVNGHDDEGEETIENLADNGGLPEPEDTTQYITGASGQLSLAVGGRKPDSASFKMNGKEVKLAERTQFPKGETVRLDVIARIDEVKFRDKHDDIGEVTHTTRVHVAVPVSVQRNTPVERLEAAVLDLLDGGATRDDIDDIVEKTVSAHDAEVR